MRLGLVLLLLLGLSLAASAAPWSPYVKFGGQFEVPLAATHFTSLFRTMDVDFDAYPSFGSQTELGATMGRLDLYGAFRWSDSYDVWVTDDWYWTSDSTAASNANVFAWRDSRWMLGGRYRWGGDGQAVRPVAGAALTLGRTQFHHSEDARLYRALSGRTTTTRTGGTRTTKLTPGLLLEFGMDIDVGLPVEFSLMSQFGRFEAAFGRDVVTGWGSHYLVMVPAVQFSARYVLPVRFGR